MDTRLIENIIAIETRGSISGAAEAQFMTQPALTQQLGRLEKELGTALFERHKHGMVPTYAGRIYLEAAHDIIDRKNEAYKIIRDIADDSAGELSLAFTPESGSVAFAEIYPEFHRRYPGIIVRPFEARGSELTHMVLRRQVSFCIAAYFDSEKTKELEYRDIGSQCMVLGIPESHPLACLGCRDGYADPPLMDLTRLSSERFILHGRGTSMRVMEQRAFEAAGFRPEILFETVNYFTILKMVSGQAGPAFFPQAYADPAFPITYFSVLPGETWTQSIVYLKGAYISRPEKYLMDLFYDYFLAGYDRIKAAHSDCRPEGLQI